MKKLIVLATLAALPAAAMADVVISGNIGVAAVNVKTKDEGAKTSANQLDRQTGEIVFSGNEDLGNGLKTIWQVATRLDASGNETNNWAGRDTFIGLAGDFGKVRFGKLSNPTNSGFGTVSPFAYVDMDSADDSSVYRAGEARTANTVRYDSPNVAGFSAAVSVQLRPEATSNEASYSVVPELDPVTGLPTGDFEIKTTAANRAAPYAAGLGLKYAAGPFTVSYAYGSFKDQIKGFEFASGDKDAAVAGAKTTTNQLNFVYSEDALTAGLAYGDAKAKLENGDYNKQRGYGVFASYAIGNITPAVSFWKEGKLKDNDGDVASSFNVVTLGVDYALSKRTSAGVEMQFQGARKDLSAGNTGEKYGKQTVSAVYLTHKF